MFCAWLADWPAGSWASFSQASFALSAVCSLLIGAPVTKRGGPSSFLFLFFAFLLLLSSSFSSSFSFPFILSQSVESIGVGWMDNSQEEEEEDRGQRPLLEEPEDALDRFKVDVAAIEDGPAARIVLYNVNLPRRLWQDEASLIRIRDRVVRDFNNDAGIYFQLSATYTLVNRENGEVRTWSGSFNPRNRVISELTSHASFEPDSFVPFVLAHSSPDWVFDKLTAAGGGLLTDGKPSVWVVDEIKSIVISFQCRLGVTHSLFSRYPPLNWWRRRYGNRGKRQRGVRFELG